jgi:hypothetical protein
MRCALAAALLMLIPAAGACNLPQSTPNSLVPKTFIYDKGWVIPGLAAASVVRRYVDEAGSNVVNYKPTTNAEVDVQGFDLSPDGQSLRFVPGYEQLVTDIIEYRVQDRAYAYTVLTVSLGKAEPPMSQRTQSSIPHRTQTKGTRKTVPGGILGCGFTILWYFDADGDGRFESLEYIGFGGPYTNATPCPTTPEWALKLLPNRKAAESCTATDPRMAAERDLKTLPPALQNLLDFRPVPPTLAPRTDK